MNNFWKDLKRPIKVLAPMAGYTDAAFRLLAREFGADVVMTELVSADAIAYGKYSVLSTQYTAGRKILKFNRVVGKKNQSTGDLLSFFEHERPVVVQLFGKYPAKFAKAVKWISENLKPDGIDINMGCPARKVVGSDHGAALIKYPELAAEIIQAVKENTNLPVSVKTRLGWDDPATILEFAPALYKAGIDAIIIHGRTYKQGFKGEADWTNIYKVKEILPELVVIGNGGVKSVEGLKLKVKNLDGAAIGQAAFGRPWVFSDHDLDKAKLKRLIFRHAELVFATKGEHGLIEFRKHLLKYLAGFDGAKELRKEAVIIQSMKDIRELIKKL
ncbi:MAG: tRNA-dihydrouridine synthase family protein [bacterium]|nr:tRNA-dihydrouridine synthase family protein [bacterium]